MNNGSIFITVIIFYLLPHTFIFSFVAEYLTAFSPSITLLSVWVSRSFQEGVWIVTSCLVDAVFILPLFSRPPISVALSQPSFLPMCLGEIRSCSL